MARARLRLVSSERQAPSARVPASEPPLDDAQLLAAVRAGDADAASEFYERVRPRVDTTIRALAGSASPDHDDLAQQSLVEVVLSLERYQGHCTLETWAATIAARTVFKHFRRRTIERRVFQDPGGEVPESSSGMNATRRIVARDMAAHIRRHLDDMEPDKAEAFLLHDVCGFDAREVAGIAGISEAAAHARIARGRRELHARLASDPDLKDVLEDMEVEP